MYFSSALLALASAAGVIAAPAQDMSSSLQQLGEKIRRSTPTGTGTDSGYFYSYYFNDSGNVTYNNLGAGAYNVSWALGSGGNFVAGKGWNLGAARNITYGGTWNGASVNAYLSVYGWTTNPLVEYYILENFGVYNPSGGLTQLGTVNTDGANYGIFKNVRTNEPSINGTQTFNQYWSVRQTKRTGGTVTTANHFNAWAAAGLPLGDFNYQIVAAEGYESTGSAALNVTSPA